MNIYKVPIVGLVVATWQHWNAYALHKQACDEYWKAKTRESEDATWRHFSLASDALEHCITAMAWTFLPLAALGLLVCIVGLAVSLR